jgi:hypothetical protein
MQTSRETNNTDGIRSKRRCLTGMQPD